MDFMEKSLWQKMLDRTIGEPQKAQAAPQKNYLDDPEYLKKQKEEVAKYFRGEKSE